MRIRRRLGLALAVDRLVLARQRQPFTTVDVERGPARQIGHPGLGALNGKRRVPTLVLDDGEVLTEMVGVLLFLDERTTPRSAAERRRLVEWLSYLATELHQAVLGPMFDRASPEEARTDATERLLPPILAHLDRTLEGRTALLGPDRPSTADAYLYWALVLLDFRQRPVGEHLRAFRSAMESDPTVAALLAEEVGRLRARPSA